MILKPFSYKVNLKEYLQEKKKLWKFFADNKIEQQDIENFNTQILKNCYRLSRELHPSYHQIIDEVKTVFNINNTVALYQAQNNDYNNASVYWLNNEVHIVLSGNFLNEYSIEELKVIIAHELSHVYLYQYENGDFDITERIIKAISSDMRSPNTYFESARLYSLFVELFCDYGSFLATNNRDLVINTLIKIHTGIKNVYAEEYLQQINEIFSNKNTKSEQITHPEIYYRVKSLELLTIDFENGEKEISNMIIGKTSLQELDIFQQKRWQDIVKITVSYIMQQDLMIAEEVYSSTAESYLKKEKIRKVEDNDINSLSDFIASSDKSLQEFIAFILFDFAMTDDELKNEALIIMLQISEILKIEEAFINIIKKEFKWSELQFRDFLKKSKK